MLAHLHSTHCGIVPGKACKCFVGRWQRMNVITGKGLQMFRWSKAVGTRQCMNVITLETTLHCGPQKWVTATGWVSGHTSEMALRQTFFRIPMMKDENVIFFIKLDLIWLLDT